MTVKGDETINMQIADYIAIASICVSLGISIVGGIYAVVTSTRKYELAEQYKRELLEWYEKTVILIMELLVTRKKKDKDLLLSRLSAQIEVGRFYFPNVKKDDGYGTRKPSAYQGYRHLALDFLVYIYEILKREDFEQYTEQVLSMERQFTSLVFDCIDPNKRKKQLKRYADYVMPKDITINDLANMKDAQSCAFWESIYGMRGNS